MNSRFKIEFTTAPSGEEVKALTRGINEDSLKKGAASTVEPFAFLMHDENGNMVAGCNGHIIYGAIYTAQLWVSDALKRQRVGTQLMEKVHQYGREKGCRIATLRTMSFQAAPFYKKLGYTLRYEEDGYMDGHSLLYFKKDL